jgi:hypothetical protein
VPLVDVALEYNIVEPELQAHIAHGLYDGHLVDGIQVQKVTTASQNKCRTR